MSTYTMLTAEGIALECIQLKIDHDGESLILFLETHLLEIFTYVHRHMKNVVH